MNRLTDIGPGDLPYSGTGHNKIIEGVSHVQHHVVWAMWQVCNAEEFNQNCGSLAIGQTFSSRSVKCEPYALVIISVC